MSIMNEHKSFSKTRAMGLVCLLIIIIIAFSVSAAASRSASLSKSTIRFEGSVDGENLTIFAFLPSKVKAPAPDKIKVWISDLSKTPISLSDKTEYVSSSHMVKAVIPSGKIKVANKALYTLWYKFSDGQSETAGAVSLREVLGSMNLRIYAPSTFQVGTRGSLRVTVHERHSFRPLKGVEVIGTFEKDNISRPLFAATTNQDGTFGFDFPVPDDLGDSATIKFVATRGAEKIEYSTSVSFARTERIMVTSDKPLYQPGQVIHIRSLALSHATRKPISNTSAMIEVEDSKGNKVYKIKGKTNNYGIFSADFQLATELNMGNYRIRSTVGDHSAEKTVEVKRYVLPKFKIEITTDRPFYKPGETVTGSIDAQYIFGKPVSGGKVKITGFASIVGAERFATLEGKTDAGGKYSFEMKLPDYFVGQNVDAGLARAQFRVEVVDKADHKQTALKSVTVSKAALNIILVPESGTIVKGLSNRLFVMVSKPDGSPAQAIVHDPWDGNLNHKTDALGLVTLNSPVVKNGLKFDLLVDDEFGNNVSKRFNFHVKYDALVLLRSDRPVYKVGDKADLAIFAFNPASKTVYVDIINNKQIILTAAKDIEGGKATVDLTITPEMSGSVVLHAYILNPNGNMVRDTRLIYVNSASDLNIGIEPSKEKFRPGQKASIDFKVTDSSGHPVAAALGVTIVDEAVFALQDMQPGFEKVFFLLEKELMKPRYEFHSFTPHGLVKEKNISASKERGYQVMLASIEPAVTYGIASNSFALLSTDETNGMRTQVMHDLNKINAKLKALVKSGADKNKVVGLLSQEDLQDPWGHRYQIYYFDQTALYQIQSDGPDRRRYTDDDVWAIDEKMQARYRNRASKLKMAGARRERPMAGNGGGGMAFGGAVGEVGAAPAMDRMMIMDESEADDDKDAVTRTATGKENRNTSGIRVRRFFPETLYTNPALITDGNGHAAIDLDMADSITTRRIGAMANSGGGLLGSASAPIVVFQDFFVDIDFPVALTRNDEVTVPVALYNYLKKKQTITLTIKEGDWYELLEGKPVRKIKLKPGEVRSVKIKIRANKVGKHNLTVYAKGTRLSDAVMRPVEIVPDGRKFEKSFSDRLEGDVEHTFIIPEGAIFDASKLFVKIYPGIMSQVIEGLDSILRMPNGCFEQTSSATYPNIMVLDYMKTTGKITPEIRMKAEGYINQGYQRLLSFEVTGGGFEWFGRAPAHNILTAYGLMEFFDMSKVHNVDPAVITRTAKFLMSKQKENGSWEPSTRVLDTVASKFKTDVIRNTAYMTWALAKAEQTGPSLGKAQSYLETNLSKVEDAYTLALILNAFAYSQGKEDSYDKVLSKLLGMREEKDGATWWPGPEKTSISSSGKSAEIETTALVGQALLLKERSPQVVNGIISYLTKNKDTFGNWHSTQATVYALKVLIMSAKNSAGNVNGEVSITVNGKDAQGVSVTPDNADVLKLIDATPFLKQGENSIKLSFGGEGQTMYQIIGGYFIPWKALNMSTYQDALSIDVDYDKTTLQKDDMVTCKVKVESKIKGDLGMVVVDLGVPPGFQVQTGDLSELVGSGVIQKFETTGRQVIVYLDKVLMGKSVSFSYRLLAKFPVKAKTPVTKVYQYYNPDINANAEPVSIVVNE